MAKILSELMDKTLLIGKDLFQRIPTPPQPLDKADSSRSLVSEILVPLKPGTMESSFESSKGHSQCSVSMMMLDSSDRNCKYGTACARLFHAATWILEHEVRLPDGGSEIVELPADEDSNSRNFLLNNTCNCLM